MSFSAVSTMLEKTTVLADAVTAGLEPTKEPEITKLPRRCGVTLKVTDVAPCAVTRAGASAVVDVVMAIALPAGRVVELPNESLWVTVTVSGLPTKVEPEVTTVLGRLNTNWLAAVGVKVTDVEPVTDAPFAVTKNVPAVVTGVAVVNVVEPVVRVEVPMGVPLTLTVTLPEAVVAVLLLAS